MEYLVEAAAAEAEAISAALAAAKARQINGEVEQSPDRDRGAEATPSGKQISSLIKMPDSALTNSTPPAGVRLHHRAVSNNILFPLNDMFYLLCSNHFTKGLKCLCYCMLKFEMLLNVFLINICRSLLLQRLEVLWVVWLGNFPLINLKMKADGLAMVPQRVQLRLESYWIGKCLSIVCLKRYSLSFNRN